MVRDAPEVLQHLADRTLAETDRKEAEQKKDSARKALDQIMATSLASFQAAIMPACGTSVLRSPYAS
jgi:hypothetical protein